jgi:hypothetical protein
MLLIISIFTLSGMNTYSIPTKDCNTLKQSYEVLLDKLNQNETLGYSMVCSNEK